MRFAKGARNFSFSAQARVVSLRKKSRTDEKQSQRPADRSGVNYTDCADLLRRSTPDAKELTQV
jgi:hypothetical protein